MTPELAQIVRVVDALIDVADSLSAITRDLIDEKDGRNEAALEKLTEVHAALAPLLDQLKEETK
jgi:hypothetical protein